MPGAGFIHAIVSGACFAVMGFLVRLNPGDFPVGEQVFSRALVSCLCLLPFVWREIPQLFHISAKSLWLRSAAGASSVGFYFFSLYGTNTATANMLYSSAPVFVCILAFFLEGHRFKRLESLGIFLILAGNVLLYLPQSTALPVLAGLAGTAGALFAGIAMFSLGTAARIFSPGLIVFSFSFACGIVGLLIPGDWLMPTTTLAWIAPVLMGLFGLAAQLTLTWSFLHLDSPVASALVRSAILWGAALEILFFDMSFSFWDWMSYFLVLIGIYVLQVLGKEEKTSR